MKRLAGRPIINSAKISNLWRRALSAASPAAGAVHEAQLVNAEHLPEEGAVVVACAWHGPLDPMTADLALPRRVQQVDTRSEDPSVEKAVEQGRILLVFPEAEPSPDDRVHRGLIGLGELALRHDLAVVPAAVVSGRLVLAEALDFHRHAGLVVDRPIARAVTDEIMAAVAEVSGRRYSDLTAAAARATAREEKARTSRIRRVQRLQRQLALREAHAARHQAAEEERRDLHRRAELAEAQARARVQGGSPE